MHAVVRLICVSILACVPFLLLNHYSTDLSTPLRVAMTSFTSYLVFQQFPIRPYQHRIYTFPHMPIHTNANYIHKPGPTLYIHDHANVIVTDSGTIVLTTNPGMKLKLLIQHLQKKSAFTNAKKQSLIPHVSSRTREHMLAHAKRSLLKRAAA